MPHPELGRPLPKHDAVLFEDAGAVRLFARVYPEVFDGPVLCATDATRAPVQKIGRSSAASSLASEPSPRHAMAPSPSGW